jgi:hypothetical protein
MTQNDDIKHIGVEGIRTRYFEKGSGAALVLIHGGAMGTGSSLNIFGEKIVDEDLMWIGDPSYITDRLRWLRDECGANFIISNMSPGSLEHEKVAKSMELLATKVMPQLA